MATLLSQHRFGYSILDKLTAAIVIIIALLPPVFIILFRGAYANLFFIAAYVVITLVFIYNRVIVFSLQKDDYERYITSELKKSASSLPISMNIAFFEGYIQVGSANEEMTIHLKNVEKVKQAGSSLFILYKSENNKKHILPFQLTEIPRPIQSKIYRYFTESGYSLSLKSDE